MFSNQANFFHDTKRINYTVLEKFKVARNFTVLTAEFNVKNDHFYHTAYTTTSSSVMSGALTRKIQLS